MHSGVCVWKISTLLRGRGMIRSSRRIFASLSFKSGLIRAIGALRLIERSHSGRTRLLRFQVLGSAQIEYQSTVLSPICRIQSTVDGSTNETLCSLSRRKTKRNQTIRSTSTSRRRMIPLKSGSAGGSQAKGFPDSAGHEVQERRHRAHLHLAHHGYRAAGL